MSKEPHYINHSQERALPIQPGERIDFVDILRGFAVFGILAVNMADYSGHTTDLLEPLAAIDWWVLVLIRFFISSKFYSLFSFLFGWGMSVQMENARARGTNFTSFFLRRLFILLLIGLMHGVFIWSGDILSVYALMGSLLLLLRNRSERTILIFMVLCLLLPTFLYAPWKVPIDIVSHYKNLTAFLRLELASRGDYSSGSYLEITQLRFEEYLRLLSQFLYYFGNIFSMFLLGLLFGKRRIFQEVDRHLPFLYKVMVGGLILGVLATALNVWLILHPSEMPAVWLPGRYHQMVQRTAYTFGAPALMLFYVSGLILLVRNKYWYNLLSPLADVGRMTLSNYLFQSLLVTLIFYNYGLGLFGEISPFIGLVLTVFIFLIQLRISAWWFDRHRYGPVEWFWRFLTYGRDPSSLPETDSAPGKKTGWNHMVRQFLTQLHPGWELAGAWFVLLVWAGLLIAWNQQIQTARQASLLHLVPSVTNTLESAAIQPVTAEQAGETGQTGGLVLTFQQEPYLPGEMAASGDVETLAGTFDLEQALSEIETLTSEIYLGRQAGSPQGWAAGDYLADQFANSGLLPLGDHGTYFQEFPVLYTPLKSTPRLYLESHSGSASEQFTAYRDFVPVVRWYAGSGTGEGQVYWMNRCAEEDFAARDVTGKVLLCLRDSTPNWLQHLSRRALEHGATALLFLTDPEIWPPDFGWSFKEVWVPEPLPLFYVYPDMVARLLTGSGKTVADLKANPPPYLLESTVGFEIQTEESSGCPGTNCIARNVIGILPGRDPTYANEAIILGGHYDHMGQAPNGIVWPGANDDASGVAVLLEIARSWNEQGYIPKRSVIFAAWDAEELGLLGSIHYVEDPPFQLENTVAMIQLDMIGAGIETLYIDGHSPLSEEIKHIAETLGIEAGIVNSGGSDHIPFLTAGVSASALVWGTPEEGETSYHRPIDTIQAIDGERLRSAAQIAELTLLNLAESEPSIKEMLVSRAKAAQEGNLDAFLSSSNPDQDQTDRYWLQDLQSLQPERVSLEAENMLIAGNFASASVKIVVNYLEPTENITRTLVARIPVTFKNGPTGWLWAGPQQVWDETESSLDENTVFNVSYPPGKEMGVSGVGISAIEKYQQITSLLGLSPDVHARLLLLPDKDALWGSTALSQARDQFAWVTPGEIKLAYSEAISTSLHLQDALVQLAVAEAGVNKALAPWLWQGLPLVLRGHYQPISTQIQFLPGLQGALEQGSPPPGLVSSWAATAYLQKRLGWSGLGRFIEKLGQLCQSGCDEKQALEAVLLEFTAMDTTSFEENWQDTWRTRLENVQRALDALLAKRSLAFSSGDKQILLETIDRSVPNLDMEETHWMEDFQANLPQQFNLMGRPLAFLEDGSLLAEITMEYQLAGNDETSTVFATLLTPADTGYRWAGPLMELIPGEQVDILFPSAKADLAAALQSRAEQIYKKLASVLNVTQTDKLTIKLYETPASYHASISVTLPRIIAENGWTKTGESIKLTIVEGGNLEDYTGVLANLLSRSLLFQCSVEVNWLVDGISSYLSRPYDFDSNSPAFGQQTAQLFEAVKSEETSALNNTLPTTQLSREELELGKSVARDAVDFLVSNYGWPTLLEILDAQKRGSSLDNAFQASLGITLEQFKKNWRASLLNSHIRPEWVEIAQAFIPEQAMKSVDYLASPNLEGRQAGSPGSAAAAQFIATAFEAYGLLPIGDVISKTTELENSLQIIPSINSVSGNLAAYFQTFPISYTYQASISELEFLRETGEPSLSLIHRRDFMLVDGGACTGATSGPLVWGGNQAYPNIDLEGKIILRTTSNDPQVEINTAMSHGAAALLLTNSKREPEELYAKQPVTLQVLLGASIPVFDITQPGFSRLLESLGYDRQSILKLPVFQPLDEIVRFDCNPYRFDTVQTANVLGLLPGSDPYLSQELLILGAHYDYVGNDPDGLRYSGANDNASGVAVLLEIARLFHTQDYHPKRSILFAAWGAQELGQVGSNYYVTNPLFPLHDTIAMIQLDGVGGGDGFNLGVQGSTKTDGEVLFYINAAEQVLEEKLVYTPPFNVSDDTPFRQAGLPSVLISWRLANDDNLPDDLGNSVRPEHLNIAGRVITLLLLALTR